MLSPLDLRFFQSELEGSSGGGLSTLEIPKTELCLLFPDVTRGQAKYGAAEYVKVFAINTNAADILFVSRLWLLMQPNSGIQIAIGIGDLTDTDPDPIHFFSPTDPANAIYLGDLAPNAITPIWIRRIVPAGTPEFDRGFFQLALTGKALQGV